MADENTIDNPALCEELSARVAELEAALSEDQDKNAVLVQQVVDAEDNIANRECMLTGRKVEEKVDIGQMGGETFRMLNCER
jgi:hypothetical protein